MENGQQNEEGVVIPTAKYLNKLSMRKSGLPILKVRFPDGTEQPYWNTLSANNIQSRNGQQICKI
jgi:sucrose phosphorylase